MGQKQLRKGRLYSRALYKKVEAMNEKGEKKVIKTWSRLLHHLPRIRRTHF